MNRYAIIISGVVGVPRPYAEREPGSVAIPHYVRQGDVTEDGLVFHRDGAVLVDPGYPIQTSRIMRELKGGAGGELQTWLGAFLCPTPNLGLAEAMIRLLAQPEIMSTDPRLLAIRPWFEAQWGAERVAELLRP